MESSFAPGCGKHGGAGMNHGDKSLMLAAGCHPSPQRMVGLSLVQPDTLEWLTADVCHVLCAHARGAEAWGHGKMPQTGRPCRPSTSPAMDLTSAFAARQATGFSGGGGVYGMGSEHLPEGAVTSGLQLAGISLQLSNRFSGINEVVVAIDQGTQSTRVFVFDKHQKPVGTHQVALKQIRSQAGWCEHDPLEILLCVQECLVGAIKDAQTKLGEVSVRALGITNQRETTVVWSRTTGQPIHNAIVWLDMRTQEICKKMEEELGSQDYFRSITGLPISTYFSAFKMKWLLDNDPDVKKAFDDGDAMFGTIDSWLIYNLTGGPECGVHVTDVSNAARTNLMNLETCQWHAPFVQLFGLTEAALPRIVSNAEVYGLMHAPPHPAYVGVPISGSLGDQQSALLGQRCQQGEAKNTYGTGCFCLLHTGPKIIQSEHGLLTTVGFKLGPDVPTDYALEGAVAVAGMGISWLKDNLGMISCAEDVELLANLVPDTGGVHFVPAFSGLLAPYWRNDAKGVICGLTTFTNRSHICRALLEAICWQTREVLDAMEHDADMGKGLAVLRVDGGMTKNNLLMQTQADFLEVPVLRPNFQETTCLGAALAAGIGAGLWDVPYVFAVHNYSNVRFTPSLQPGAADSRYAMWKAAVQLSFGLTVPEVEEFSRITIQGCA